MYFTYILNEQKKGSNYKNDHVTQILEGMRGILFCKYALAAATPLPNFTG